MSSTEIIMLTGCESLCRREVIKLTALFEHILNHLNLEGERFCILNVYEAHCYFFILIIDNVDALLCVEESLQQCTIYR